MTMTKAQRAVAHLLKRIAADPRLAYYFDPLTESMSLLTAAHAETHGIDVEEVRKEYYPALRFEAPPKPYDGSKIAIPEPTFQQVANALNAAMSIALLHAPRLHQQIIEAAIALDDAATNQGA
jgi:hypothetical protein